MEFLKNYTYKVSCRVAKILKQKSESNIYS